MCSKNESGPKTIPWETPDSISAYLEKLPSTTTHCYLFFFKVTDPNESFAISELYCVYIALVFPEVCYRAPYQMLSKSLVWLHRFVFSD